jgi:hypothetical protein
LTQNDGEFLKDRLKKQFAAPIFKPFEKSQQVQYIRALFALDTKTSTRCFLRPS